MLKNIRYLLVLMGFITLLSGCGNAAMKGNSSQKVTNASQMPDIVFLVTIDYVRQAAESQGERQIMFYDKNGTYYSSDDENVCNMDFKELVSEFSAGNLVENIEFHGNCEVEELFENYQKLCKVSEQKDLELRYPTEGPAVEEDVWTWYGLYFDSQGELNALVYHKKDAFGDHMTNSKTANEIYEWYEEAIQENND